MIHVFKGSAVLKTVGSSPVSNPPCRKRVEVSEHLRSTMRLHVLACPAASLVRNSEPDRWNTSLGEEIMVVEGEPNRGPSFGSCSDIAIPTYCTARR